MTRSIGSPIARRRAIIKSAKGYYGRRKNTIRIARQAVMRALSYAYRDRRQRKRQMRSLWIQRINSAARKEGLTYAGFMYGLNKSGILINRKMLADLAVMDSEAFASLAKQVAPNVPENCKRKIVEEAMSN